MPCYHMRWQVKIPLLFTTAYDLLMHVVAMDGPLADGRHRLAYHA